ncbi:MAG: nitrous oxide reductase accessory protein NosL [Devosiaceae bacterium]|nr:nitrous oxide reductase accessory protein NosL [Devosiaceae bacterium]
MSFGRSVFALLLLVLLSACQDGGVTEKPTPVELTPEAAGHYCQMIILEHVGPKAQVHLAGFAAPLWFSQVRDGIAYLKSPEQSAKIVALYVNDMGVAPSWEKPGQNNWIDANEAYFVVGSDATGGMGAPEIVPFSQVEKAQEFADERGGEVLRLSDISQEAVLSPVSFQSHAAGE